MHVAAAESRGLVGQGEIRRTLPSVLQLAGKRKNASDRPCRTRADPLVHDMISIDRLSLLHRYAQGQSTSRACLRKSDIAADFGLRESLASLQHQRHEQFWILVGRSTHWRADMLSDGNRDSRHLRRTLAHASRCAVAAACGRSATPASGGTCIPQKAVDVRCRRTDSHAGRSHPAASDRRCRLRGGKARGSNARRHRTDRPGRCPRSSETARLTSAFQDRLLNRWHLQPALHCRTRGMRSSPSWHSSLYC